MKPITFTLCVEAIEEDRLVCQLYTQSEENTLFYAIADGAVFFSQENRIAAIIRNNHLQLRKILNSAIDGRLQPGQIINCVLIENFVFLQEEHFNRFICQDRRNGKLNISINDTGLQKVYKIFADGSCNHEIGKSGYGGLIEAPDGTRQIFFKSFSAGTSNLMELLAIVEGLQRLVAEEVIQINTDSRFVIRGLVQWVHFWKHNNWQTAYGRDARYSEHWQRAYSLCEGKYLEFKWIKEHCGHAEQDLCHQLAQNAAINITSGD